jgi:hypothetical protein
MARYAVIVARTRSDLYGYLQRQFAEDEDAQVIFDRRHEERRRRKETHGSERRREERRGRRGKDPGLSFHGFLVVRQTSEGSEIKIQWRPPWWESGKPGEPVGLEGQQWPRESHALETRERVSGCVIGGQQPLCVSSKLPTEHGQVTARADMAERRCGWLEEEIQNLRTENEQFRRERRRFAETVKILVRKLGESAGETF